ncbi:MAG: hypothetical protein AAFY56_11435 [Pseudomonadota bacterium]
MSAMLLAMMLNCVVWLEPAFKDSFYLLDLCVCFALDLGAAFGGQL